MRPKGWRCDPAWVEHYSKIDRERMDREIQRIKDGVKATMQRIQEERQRAKSIHSYGGYEVPEAI